MGNNSGPVKPKRMVIPAPEQHVDTPKPVPPLDTQFEALDTITVTYVSPILRAGEGHPFRVICQTDTDTQNFWFNNQRDALRFRRLAASHRDANTD